MEIFRRPSEWDYSWLASLKTEVALCRYYEHARYALLCAAADPLIIIPWTFPLGALPHLFASRHLLGPIFTLASYLPAKVKFPQMPYRQARELLTYDPEILQAIIQDFCDAESPTEEKLKFYASMGAIEQAREIVDRLKTKPLPPRSKRGGGARIRQEQTDMKYLGAAKLLTCMSAPEACQYTTKILGEPLFGNESDWSRAKKRAIATLAPYHAEAALLYKALSETRILKSFTHYDGDEPQIEWA